MSKRWSSIGFWGVASASLLARAVPAQCPDWGDAFARVQGLNAAVYAAAVFDDGTGPALYAAGTFTRAGGASANRIARWNGATWSTLGSGLNDEVRALLVFDDGSGPALYAGGAFDSADGAPAAHLAKWNGLDWSAVGSGFDDSVTALAVFDDGQGPRLHAAGWFTAADGSPASRVARWDGQSWSALASGVDGTVYALSVFDSGSGPALCAAGEFLSAGGASARRIAQWNGTAWSALGAGLGDGVYALAVFDSGSGPELHAAGKFTLADGSPGNHIARWNGQSWSPLGLGTDGVILALSVFDDGGGDALFAGGTFAQAGGSPSKYLARWTGASWSAPSGGSVRGGGVNALCAFDAGSGPGLIAGGAFVAAGGTAADHVAQWKGGRWKALPARSTGLNDSVNALAVFDDGGGASLYAGGSFTSAGEVSADGIASWNGMNWSALASGLGGGTAYALTTFDDGTGAKLYAGGIFSRAGDVVTKNIARWNGASWEAAGSGLDQSFGIQALAVFDDGQGPALYAGGWPGDFGLMVEVMKWDGTSWSALPPLESTSTDTATISALTVFDDGQGAALYAGGTFNLAGGIAAKRIARWNGSQWTALGNGANGTVEVIAALDDGLGPALYIGGEFTNPGSHIARWNGASWSSVGFGFNGSVRALTIFDDGNAPALYAGGSFTLTGNAPLPHLAKWNGVFWSTASGGTDGEVREILVRANGLDGGSTLFVGGDFEHAGEKLSPRLAELRGCGIATFCFGDGTGELCPCFNLGLPRHGCDNSLGTGGAVLSASGSTRPDTLGLTASSELASALSIFLQGDANLYPGVLFGDGVLCAGGNLKRLYSATASGGVVIAPAAGDPSISQRSAALGDPITPGSIRYYQTYYRDPNASFCAAPQGDTWNVTNGIRVIW